MKNLLLITFLFSCTLLFSQTYDLEVRQGVYESLEKSTSVTNGQVWDDLDYVIPIGFDFPFYNITMDTLFSGGDIIFFNVSDESNAGDSLFSAVIPMVADIIDLGYASGEALSNISYLVQGVQGDRILKIEWSNVGFYNSLYSDASDFMNMQLWLYEANGTFELHFGNSDIANPFDIFLENSGPVIGLVGDFSQENGEFTEFLVLEGDPENPNVVFLDEDSYEYFYYEYALDTMPASGTIYSFNRIAPPVSTDEIRELSTQFSVHPNPASSSISLRTQMDYSTIRSVSIFDNNGALMKTIESDYDNINIEQFTSGIYNIQILTDEGLASKQFVKID